MNVTKYTRGLKLSFTFVSLGFLLIITSVAAIANAQEPPSPRATATPIRAQLQDRVDAVKASTTERREAMQEQMEERRAALQERAQERITNLAANMSNRMEAAIARLRNVSGRLESRIEKLQAEGVDTTDAESILASAQAELDNASDILSDIDEQVADTVGSETPREAWQSLRETYTSARDAILLAHQGLRNTVAALKVAVADAGVGEGRSDAVDNANTDHASSSDANSEESSTEDES